MQYNLFFKTALLGCMVCLQSCGWVDSTGNQTDGAELEEELEGIRIPITAYESPTKRLQDGESTALLEQTASLTKFDGVGRGVRDWNWELIAQGDDQACNDIPGFDADFAVDSLEEACTSQSQCEVQIDELESIDESEFLLTLPSLKSSVVLSYRVSSEYEDGSSISRDQFICAVAVNEAPSANDDNYRVLAGVQRTIRAKDPDNLLANDFDDVDARNQPLSVNPQAIVPPQYAELFLLLAEGGFIYETAPDIALNAEGKQTDSFVYSVSDGVHETQATVTFSIVASNSEPLLIGTLPDTEINLSELLSGPEYEVNVAAYFNDADNDPLSYYFKADDLPDGLSVMIDENGLLSIDINPDEPVRIAGDWQIDVIASDGLATSSSDFQLTISDTEQNPNRAPTVTDISNAFVRNSFEYDVSVFFDDPDGDELNFSSVQLPPGVSLSTSGVLSGSSSDANSGSFFVVIKATDENGASVSDGFRLVIN